jgi:glycosidase
MNRILSLLIFIILTNAALKAQIYAPEGLNMPGSWNSWVNPPTNSAFAGSAQTSGGRVVLLNLLGTKPYQTIFHAAASGGDVVGGTYSFDFSSGPSTNYWTNKWNGTSVVMNTLQTYTHVASGGTDNSIILTNDKWYVMNFQNIGYVNTQAIFMELSGNPVTFGTVSSSPMMPTASDNVTVTVNVGGSLAAEEKVYLRYSADGWATSSILAVNFSGTVGTAVIPMQPDSTNVEYYVFSTIISNPTSDYDLYTVRFTNNSGANYKYTVGAVLDCSGQIGVVTNNPAFPLDGGSVVITFDATRGNGGLAGYTGDVYAHTGVITNLSTSSTDWKYVKTTWGVNTPDTKMTRIGTDLYQLTIPNIRTYYGVPIAETILKMAFVFRSDFPVPVTGTTFLQCKNADGSDIFVDVYADTLNVKILSPSKKEPLVDQNSLVPVCVSALAANQITLYIDGLQVNQGAAPDMTYGLNTGLYAPGQHTIVADADNGTNHARDTTYFYLRGDVVVEDLPAGVQNGINYIDNTTVTLVLSDPPGLKYFVFAIGEFNNWTATDAGYMKRTPDGKHFWVTLSGLTAGKEYSFQYFIDNKLKIADPYADKILDPWNDKYIPSSTYPALKAYPWDKTTGIVSVFQTAQTPYSWLVPNFMPAAVGSTQNKLIVYEMLIRDFTTSHNIVAAKAKLDYLQNLGVNAIELMPVNEFEGNDSWGYNPDFYFAFDKYYGRKNDLKAFVDACHQRGIAVIMDMVLNHSFSLSPLAEMYWNSNLNQPSADNPWYNQTAPHPYSPGSDFNHESPYTKEFVKRILNYWITEYKVDGYRFDLSKGFTQFNSGTDVGLWGNYDQSRINILQDYYNTVKATNSNAYFILEHLSDNDEEVVLAGFGSMLWGNMNIQFNQATMGYASNTDFSWAYYGNRGFAYPNLLPYMESHDEERLMYRNITYGNSSGVYSTADPVTALQRMQEVVPFYFSIPGPKMIWQFGELGYDISIDSGGRTGMKPVKWEYLLDPNRKNLYDTYTYMCRLKQSSDLFSSGTYSANLSGTGKTIKLSSGTVNMVLSGNFDVTGFNMTPGFQHTGTWYDFFSGTTINVTDAAGYTEYFDPGEYHLWTDSDLGIVAVKQTAKDPISIYPNPARNILYINSDQDFDVSVYNLSGQLVKTAHTDQSANTVDISELHNGIYLLKFTNNKNQFIKKITVNY